MNIPLHNKNGELKANILVNEDKYNELCKYNWFASDNGERIDAVANINGQRTTMQAFLMGENKDGLIIDHKNNNPLDNRLENLRFTSISLNNQNVRKREGCTSKYLGVSFCTEISKWRASHSNKNLGSFEDEKDAAIAYDIHVIGKYGKEAKTNFPYDTIVGLIPKETAEKKRSLPKNISMHRKKYVVQYRGKRIGGYDNLEKAIEAKTKYETERKEIEEKELKSRIIERNEQDIPIIVINHDDGTTSECLADEKDWHDLIQYSWCLKSGGYVSARVKGKQTLIHRYLLEAKDSELVEHINHNKLDNRRSNLRISTSSNNNHNKRKRKGCSSNYIGVSKRGKKFNAMITKDKVSYTLGLFDDEKKAAAAYNEKAKELYGDYANLNVI